jgi:hypothetical protein
MRSADGSGCEIVPVVQSTKSRHGNDLSADVAVGGRHSITWRTLSQPKVRTILVVVADVFGHQPFQMAFIQDDDMVEQVPATVADEAFGDTVLPRAAKAGSLRLDTEALDCADDIDVEIRSAVEDQILRNLIIGKCLSQLLGHPGAGWMSRHIPVEDAPAVMGNHEETIEHPKRKRNTWT